ncbi:MFS transporter [Nevskia soli]|uniref:MFS transporter n=1 Tax=Nevskia soli TaxID=418856 RepID=UPI00068AAA5E|nr:MFS transporter [Nevskia soli]
MEEKGDSSGTAPPASRKPPRRLPRGIWILGFVSLLMDVSSESIHSLLPVFLTTVLNASALTVGLIEGASEAIALIVKVFSGVLSDYLGRRKTLAVLGYGLGALSKPLFALATGPGVVLAARLIDRTGKGIREAPRDALVAELAPADLRGAAFGLRQALDTVGAFLGPLLAMALMLLWPNNFRTVFWIALIPAFLCVALLHFGVSEADNRPNEARANPISRANLTRLPRAYWWVVAIGAMFTLARFSEAFLILRAREGGLPVAMAPLVLIGMNLVYSASAFPFGKLSDRLDHGKLLGWALAALIAADLALAYSSQWLWVWLGVSLWGLHMGMSQGLMAAMVADTAPPDLRGTAFGMFNLLSGIATLIASALAGLLWDRHGAALTFIVGAGFSAAALSAIVWRKPDRS